MIRPLRPTDIPACLRLAGEGWDRLTAQCAQPDLESMFSSAVWKPFFYVAEENDQVIGMAGYGNSWLSYGIYDLFWHVVSKEHRKRGIGSSLVNRRLDDLRTIADVVMISTKIPDFYSKHWNFKTIAKIQTTENYGNHLMMLQMPVTPARL